MNMQSSLSVKLKMLMAKPGRRARKIRFGLLKGLNFLVDSKIQTQLLLGLWEREVFKELKELSRGIETAIDIGAGVGEYTLYFLTKTSAKTVLAIEPDEKSLPPLKENIELNRHLFNADIRIFSNFIGARTFGNQYALDYFIPMVRGICLIKADIEGAELALLNGAGDFLNLPGVRWIIEIHSKALEEECRQKLIKNGYIVKVVKNAWWRMILPERRPLPCNYWLVAHKRQVLSEKKCGVQGIFY